MDLAKTLIEVSTAKKFDFSTYKDVYTQKLAKLIDAKVAGEEIVAPPVHEHAQMINLMDALRASLAQAEPEQSEEQKPPNKMAPSKNPGPARGRPLEPREAVCPRHRHAQPITPSVAMASSRRVASSGVGLAR